MFTADEIAWWEAFFEGQQNQNASYMVQDRRLKYAFSWPLIRGSKESDAQQETTLGPILDEEEINLRVYGESRDIYVGGYQNQKMIELEKENMDEDFSDMQVGSFIAVASKQCPDKRQFWIAKVQKIISYIEDTVPKIIEVLWYAVKKGHDSFKGKYTPEKLQGRRGRGSRKKVFSIQELDISEIAIFSYNFYLNSTGCLYKKSIDRIQIRLQEYLVEKKSLREMARLAGKTPENESEMSSSSSSECEDDGGRTDV